MYVRWSASKYARSIIGMYISRVKWIFDIQWRYNVCSQQENVTRHGVRYTHPMSSLQIIRRQIDPPSLYFRSIGFYTSGWTTVFNTKRCRIGKCRLQTRETEREREDPRCPTSRHKGPRIRYILSWHLAKRATSVFPDDARARPIDKGKRSALPSLCVKRCFLTHCYQRAGDGWSRLVKQREISAKSLDILLKRISSLPPRRFLSKCAPTM